MDREIRDYIRLVLRWWWLLVISAIIPMMVTYYFVSRRQDVYQAKATILVGTSLQDPDPDPRQMSLSNTLAAAYAEMVRQRPVLEAVIERLGLESTPDQLASQISTWIHSRAQLLEIQVTDANPEAAALIANALADELIRRSPASGGGDPEQQEFVRSQLEELQAKIKSLGEDINDLTASLSGLTSAAEIQQVQDQIAELEEVRSVYQSAYADLLDVYRAESPNVLSLFDPAVVPQKPIPSKTKLIVAIAGAAGLGLALGAIFIMEYLDTSVHWEGEGMQSLLDMPLLGVVPQVTQRKALLSDGLRTTHNPLSPVMEGVRAVRANVFLMRPDQPFRTLLLTSPGTSEGKSLILANLAVVLAAAGDRVIVVDADLRKPALHEMFDQPNVLGLADVLNSHSPANEDFSSIPLQETGFDNVYLLPGGHAALDPATLLTSSRLPALLEFLKDQADVILMDSPPVLGPPDATVLATRAEGTILVVSAGFTGRRMVQQARDRLRGQKGANLLGLVMNRVKLHISDSYYYRMVPIRYGAGPEGAEPRPEGADGRHPKEPGRFGRIRLPMYGKEGDQAWLTLGEAARRLGISRARARQWCKSGRLTAARKGLRWRIAPDEIQRVFEDALERGMQYDDLSDGFYPPQ